MDMTDRFQQSPYRRQRNDVEAGTGRSSNYGEGSSSGPFEIYRTKDASVHRIRRWRYHWPRGCSATIPTVWGGDADGEWQLWQQCERKKEAGGGEAGGVQRQL
ncbi:hypothetical protein Acr_01g0003480 [Actinidia rufa]|uniref:Uncharacterized protein n=1 Tax=Actinidia rufa TaxID=165716 RepID=A0A7J0E3Q2_9ERIC|nr:hypothetical protein Acr_01g0003480 [Actinidia rufa]